MTIITLEILDRLLGHDVCEHDRELFKETFPGGMLLTAENILQALGAGMNVYYAVRIPTNRFRRYLPDHVKAKVAEFIDFLSNSNETIGYDLYLENPRTGFVFDADARRKTLEAINEFFPALKRVVGDLDYFTGGR